MDQGSAFASGMGCWTIEPPTAHTNLLPPDWEVTWAVAGCAAAKGSRAVLIIRRTRAAESAQGLRGREVAWFALLLDRGEFNTSMPGGRTFLA